MNVGIEALKKTQEGGDGFRGKMKEKGNFVIRYSKSPPLCLSDICLTREQMPCKGCCVAFIFIVSAGLLNL